MAWGAGAVLPAEYCTCGLDHLSGVMLFMINTTVRTLHEYIDIDVVIQQPVEAAIGIGCVLSGVPVCAIHVAGRGCKFHTFGSGVLFQVQVWLGTLVEQQCLNRPNGKDAPYSVADII